MKDNSLYDPCNPCPSVVRRANGIAVMMGFLSGLASIAHGYACESVVVRYRGDGLLPETGYGLAQSDSNVVFGLSTTILNHTWRLMRAYFPPPPLALQKAG